MTDRRVRRRRRLTAWLAAALLGGAGALVAVTPAHAAGTCTLTFRQAPWVPENTGTSWLIEGKMTNTAAVPSTAWMAFISFPYSAGATVPLYWNVSRAAFTPGLWLAAPWYKILQPGETATFGFEVLTPSRDVSPLPTSSQCVIYY